MAQIAAAPAPPVYHSPMGGILVAAAGIFFVLVGFGLMNSDGSAESRPNYGFAFVCFVLATALIAFGIYYSIQERARAKEAFERDYNFWQQAIAAHDRLFYCDRCDTVFDASTRAYRPADLAFQLLG